jgi:hypothetical protein
MTEALVGKTCTPCRGGIPPLTREQAALFHAQAPDWQLLEESHRIERSFRFISGRCLSSNPGKIERAWSANSGEDPQPLPYPASDRGRL